MRFSTVIVLVLALAGCGGTISQSSFGEVPLVVGSAPAAEQAGIYLATQRGYDTAEGVELQLTDADPAQGADFRLVSQPPDGCVAVLAIVRPDKLVLCADEITLQDEREKVLAVARALARGYTQAQREPTEAVGAMTTQVPELDRERLTAELDEAAPTWTAGAKYFGELAPGPGRDPSIAREAAEQSGD